MNKEPFTISVNNRNYYVIPVYAPSHSLYKIETGCDYMFTLFQKNGEWLIEEHDVKPIDVELPYSIGYAIEKHNEALLS